MGNELPVDERTGGDPQSEKRRDYNHFASMDINCALEILE
jgi:hypothetical protein